MAHIAGIPVEETLGIFGPAATAVAGAFGATVRLRWRHLREGRRPHPPAAKAPQR